ncbi:MAG: GTPase ObgE [Acidimicrobiia bacterium]
MFVDRVRVHLRAGHGGAGVVSFVKTRGRPKGKPTGGSGGAGGDVVLEARSGMATLLEYRHHPHQAAAGGTHGRGDLRHGRRGEDLVLPIPPGTQVFDDSGLLLADLVEDGQRVTVLTGGRGGRGNAAFVSSKNRAPSVCEQGEYGREASFVLELKLAADAALVGFPNAGKSTFISRVSAAKPKVADYPFTTLEPHLGVVSVDGREFILADVPGLVEGAAGGRGLGHEFLRHVERAQVLVLLLDPSIIQPLTPVEQLRVLLHELGSYLPELVDRPRLVVVGKADLPEAAEAAGSIDGALTVSAVTGEGMWPVLHRIADLVESTHREGPGREGFVLHRPVEAPFSVERVGGVWEVGGIEARRAVAFADLTMPEAAHLAARRLRRLGVDEALSAAGAAHGDLVRIGDLEFEYLPSGDEEE